MTRATPKLLSPVEGMRVPHGYALASLVMALVATVWPRLFPVLALTSARPVGIQHLTGLLTHPFVPAGLVNWAIPAGYIVLAGYLLRRELTDRQQLILAVAGAVAGGIAYEIFTSRARFFVGGSIVAWGFCGAASMFGLIRWRSISWPWRLYVVVMGFIVAVRSMDVSTPQSALTVAAVVGAALVLFWTWQRGWARQVSDA